MISAFAANTSERQCLFAGEQVELLYFPGNAPYDLVTFDIMHARANGRTGFALKLARKNDIGLFAVVPRRPHWYPASEMAHVAGLIAQAKNRPTIGYGASMGAYGVLKYGALLQTDATLAFSPQITIDPEVTGAQDRRYGRFFDPGLNGAMAVMPDDLGPNTMIMHDPEFAPDHFQQALLKGDQATRISLPHMGHRAIGTMASSAVSQMVFTAALAGDEQTVRAALRLNRAHTVDYYQGLATRAMRAKRPELALNILELGEARKGATDDSALTRARLMSALGRAGEGVALLEGLVAAHPHQVMYQRFLADALEKDDRLPEAVAVLQQALEQSQNAVLAIRLFRLLEKISPRKARNFAAKACVQWPDQATHFSGQIKAA